MPGFTMSRRIAAPPEAVFDALTDLEHAARRVSGIERIEILTDGPVGVGTRFRETRIMFKKEATEELEVTGFERPTSFAVGCESCGCRYDTVYRVTPEGDGTRVELEMTWQPLTFFAKLMSPLGRVMSGPLRKCLERDLDDLRADLEKSPSAEAAPTA